LLSLPTWTRLSSLCLHLTERERERERKRESSEKDEAIRCCPSYVDIYFLVFFLLVKKKS